jgi:hypothetical protein
MSRSVLYRLHHASTGLYPLVLRLSDKEKAAAGAAPPWTIFGLASIIAIQSNVKFEVED